MDFRFSSLLGAPFRGGNLCIHGNSTLFTPVGNRVSVLDLQSSECSTLPFECSRNVSRIAVSPNGVLLLAIDETGRAILMNAQRKVLLHRISFKTKVKALKFSPDGRYFAVGVGPQLQIWKTPGLEKTYSPFELHLSFAHFHGDITCIHWSHDGQWIIAGSKDHTARIFSFQSLRKYKPVTLSGHKDVLVGVYFLTLDEKGASDRPYTRSVYTVSKDGALLVWNFYPDNVLQQILNFDEGGKRKREDVEDGSEEGNADGDGDGDVDDGVQEVDGDEQQGNESGGEEYVRDTEMKDADSKSNEEVEGEEVEEEEDQDDKELEIILNENGIQDTDGDRKESKDRRRKKQYVRERLDSGRWKIGQKHSFKRKDAKLKAVDYHPGLNLMVAALSTGIFCIHQMPSFELLQTLSVSRRSLSTVCFNKSGEWIALGSSKLGQLLVWEWRSETYVIKQQGHYYDVNCVAFSADGSLMATGADDNKLKLWNMSSGLCFVTMNDHTQPITSVQFVSSNATVVTSSLDGTVRVYDLLRYRNFRTLVSPTPTQLSSLAVHPSGDIVCASSLDTFQIFVWSMKTGALLDVLKGHEGPVSALAFSPISETLASASWDHSVKLWDIFEGKGSTESFFHNHDVLTMAFRPDGRQLAAVTLNCQIHFWNPLTHDLDGTIDCIRDIAGGKLSTDRRSTKTTPLGKSIRTICYSPDGAFLLAAGNSKYLCCYDSRERVLLKRFQLSTNLSLDGIFDRHNSKNMTEAGPIDLIPIELSDDEFEGRYDLGMELPGTNPLLSNYKRPPIQAKSVCISPTGEVWGIASTEGVLIYTSDNALIFDPEDLDQEATPEALENSIKEGKYASTVNLALRLNESPYLYRAIENVPLDQIPIVVSSIPKSRLSLLLSSIASQLPKSPHLEFLLIWCKELFSIHGRFIQGRGKKQMIVPLRILQKSLTLLHEDLSKSCSSNMYLLRYLTLAPVEDPVDGS